MISNHVQKNFYQDKMTQIGYNFSSELKLM